MTDLPSTLTTFEIYRHDGSSGNYHADDKIDLLGYYDKATDPTIELLEDFKITNPMGHTGHKKYVYTPTKSSTKVTVRGLKVWDATEEAVLHALGPQATNDAKLLRLKLVYTDGASNAQTVKDYDHENLTGVNATYFTGHLKQYKSVFHKPGFWMVDMVFIMSSKDESDD